MAEAVPDAPPRTQAQQALDAHLLQSKNNRRGIILALCAMALFVCNDSLVKLATSSFSTGQVLVIRGLFATSIMLTVVLVSKQGKSLRFMFTRLLMVRATAESMVALCFVTSISQLALADLKIVTVKQPNAEDLSDLLFAWKVAQFVKSNAIVFCKNGMTMGVGAGQMSRLDSARIASIKAGHAGLSLQGTAVASDAFFPFRDGLDVVVDAGATCVAQPGGSMRDQEVIDAANERGVAMVFTGVRHFRH